VRESFRSSPEGSESASIWTPDFQYSVSVAQLEDEPTEAVIVRELSDVRDDSVLRDERFRDTFDNVFDTVKLTFAKPVNVVEIIDAIEALDGDEIEVEYPGDYSHCDVSIDGCPGNVRINIDSLEVTLGAKQPLLKLVEAFTNSVQSMYQLGMGGHLSLPTPQTA
jgi:hypothetical protein